MQRTAEATAARTHHYAQIGQAGNGGRLRGFTRREVRQHRTADDLWMIVNGRVYNVTPYVPFHPGGTAELLKAAGKDGTKLILREHKWVNVEQMLARCLLGGIVDE